MWETIKNNPVLKTIIVLILGVLAFGFAFNIMFGNGSSAMEHGMAAGYSPMYMHGNISGAVVILTGLIKILLVLSVLGLFTALFMYVKDVYFQNIKSNKKNDKHTAICYSCGYKISDEFNHCPQCGVKLKQTCANCGTELKKDWKCCPKCGADNNA